MVSEGICQGLTVLELGAGSVPASLAGMLLADNGARVIKIEPPEGDRLRSAVSGFLIWNRGKESMIIDARTAAGQDRVRQLAAGVDVLIEGFGSGVAEKWGVSYDRLRGDNPGLVFCSIKGFGSNGPYSQVPGYEGVIAAKAGVFTRGIFGFRDGPIFSGAPTASIGAAHFAFSGILSALLVRSRTGRGQRVEATLWQGLNPYDYGGVMTHQYATRQGQPASPAAQFVERFLITMKTKDGRWVVVNFVQPKHTHAVSRALGCAHTIVDPRFADQPRFSSAETAQAWEDILWDAFATKNYADWEPILLSDPDIGFELLRTAEEGLEHPQAIYNRDAVIVDDPVHGPIIEIAPLIGVDSGSPRIIRSAPALGENNGPVPARRPATAASALAPSHPLQGVTIVELGLLYAMPFGTTLAAAMGARVIKLEDRNGDPARIMVPRDVWAAKVMEGKESLSIDLRSSEGHAIARKLIGGADVFVQSLREGAAARLGLDYTTLSRVNPRLVYLNSPGYGVGGPYSSRPMYAYTASAVAGAYHRYAAGWLDSELAAGMTTMEAQAVIAPRLRAPLDGDANPSLAVFSAILLGLYARDTTGQGRELFTNMIRSNAFALSDDFCKYAGKVPVPLPDPENHGLGALYRLYRAKRGWVFISAQRPKDWDAFAISADRPELLVDPRFSSAQGRQTNEEELTAVLGALFATRSAAEWEHALLPKGIACVEVTETSASEFTCTDQGLRDTGLVVETDHPMFGRILRHGLPIEMSETPGRVAAGCLHGQHTEAIMQELGYNDNEIRKLAADEVIFLARG